MKTGLCFFVFLASFFGYGCAFSSDPAKSIWRTSNHKWKTYSLKGMGIAMEAPSGSLDHQSSTNAFFCLHRLMPGPLDIQDAIYMITVEVTKIPLSEYQRRLNFVPADAWDKWRFSEHRILSRFESTDKEKPNLYFCHVKHVFVGDVVYVFFAESRNCYTETYNFQKTDETILTRMANSITAIPPK